MQVRTEAGEVELGTEECFQHLVEGLEDHDPRVRRLAICGLAASGDPRAVEHIMRALGDEDPELRQRAAMALGKLGDPRAAPVLIEAAEQSDPPLHRAAILALGELGPVGISVLAKEVRCEDPGGPRPRRDRARRDP